MNTSLQEKLHSQTLADILMKILYRRVFFVFVQRFNPFTVGIANGQTENKVLTSFKHPFWVCPESS